MRTACCSGNRPAALQIWATGRAVPQQRPGPAESVAHLREAYQSQLSIRQNDLMKVFTVVTAVFCP